MRIGIYNHQHLRGGCPICTQTYVQGMIADGMKCMNRAKGIYGEDNEFVNYTDLGDYPSDNLPPKRVEVIKTEDGQMWWTAYTSFDEELKGADQVKSTFLSEIGRMFEAALTVPEIAGIIINPWNRTIMLDKHLIRIIMPD